MVLRFTDDAKTIKIVHCLRAVRLQRNRRISTSLDMRKTYHSRCLQTNSIELTMEIILFSLRRMQNNITTNNTKVVNGCFMAPHDWTSDHIVLSDTIDWSRSLSVLI